MVLGFSFLKKFQKGNSWIAVKCIKNKLYLNTNELSNLNIVHFLCVCSRYFLSKFLSKAKSSALPWRDDTLPGKQ